MKELEGIVDEMLSKLRKTYESSVKSLESEANTLLSKYEKSISELRKLIIEAFKG